LRERARVLKKEQAIVLEKPRVQLISKLLKAPPSLATTVEQAFQINDKNTTFEENQQSYPDYLD
jgi:hypothetical protein